MKKKVKFLIVSTLFLIFENTSFQKVVLAQSDNPNLYITPDQSLANKSFPLVNGNIITIKGGSFNKERNNQFHSFKEFSVPETFQVFFDNPQNIERIFARVTGQNISRISGSIRTNGQASLFLINPSGIIFGPKSTLDIQGSFLASTATSIKFSNGGKFDVFDSISHPVLTLNIPDSLEISPQSKSIIVNGNGHSLFLNDAFILTNPSNSSKGLQVKPGKSISLIGRGIDLPGGILTAESGTIDLISLDSGNVRLNPFTNAPIFSQSNLNGYYKIELSKAALLDVSGNRSGSINVLGSIISLADSSIFLLQNNDSKVGGDIRVLSDKLVLDGVLPGKDTSSGIVTTTLGSGDSGNIFIYANNLTLKNSAEIQATTFSTGKASDINIFTNHSLNLTGGSPLGLAGQSLISSQTAASGSTGNIFIKTRKLSAINGGAIATQTVGKGSAGDLIIHASDSIVVSGTIPNSRLGSTLATSSIGFGDAGQVEIKTRKLEVLSGGTVSASSFSDGNAGSLNISATEYIKVNGFSNDVEMRPSLIRAAVLLPPELFVEFLGLPQVPSGQSGGLRIKTPRLSITNGGQLSVTNDGTGDAGLLEVFSDSILLADSGIISAKTASGKGGNIALKVSNLLLLRNNSSISAEANGFGDGGNLNIDAGLIVAFPQENSDIIANASIGNGGNIFLKTQAIFGLKARNQLTSFSDISASSSFGVDGNINIQTLNNEPSSGLSDLPESVIDESDLINTSCSSFAKNSTNRISELVSTGRGGIPTKPDDYLNKSPTLSNWTIRNPQNSKIDSPNPITYPSKAETNGDLPQLIEASGWTRTHDGRLILIGETSLVSPIRTNTKATSC